MEDVGPTEYVENKSAKKSVTWKDRVENESAKGGHSRCSKEDRPPNPMAQARVDSDWRRSPPTLQEISAATREANNTLFLAESGTFYDMRDRKVLGNIFYDIGSNVSYISEPFAAKLGLVGTPKEIRVMHTGNKMRVWNTAAFKVSICGPTGMAHTVMCYGVPSVSGDLETPDWKFMEDLFPGKNFLRSLHRATGPIDILLSTTYLSLYPREVDEIGNL